MHPKQKQGNYILDFDNINSLGKGGILSLTLSNFKAVFWSYCYHSVEYCKDFYSLVAQVSISDNHFLKCILRNASEQTKESREMK